MVDLSTRPSPRRGEGWHVSSKDVIRCQHSLSLAGLGIFGEAGVLPRSVADTFVWVLEFRAGVYYAF